MKRLIYIFIVASFFASCESKDARFMRVASDTNIYETLTSKVSAYHIDAKCKKIHSADWFKPISKRTLWITNDGVIFDDMSHVAFCPTCTHTEDIEKLKSQIRLYESAK